MKIRNAIALAVAGVVLAACGGGGLSVDDGGSTGSSGGTSGTSSATVNVAPLVISAASSAGMNGTLDKTTGLPEVGFSDATGNFSSSSPNLYCRVAVYELTDSGDSKKYDIQLTYAKADRAIGLVGISLNGAAATFSARTNSGTGVSVDTVNRRIGFANVVLGAGTASIVTLNGSLEFPAFTGASADVAACSN